MPEPFVIAEFGSCHQESLARALALVRAAKAAGADAVKGQYWSDPVEMRARRGIKDPSAQYNEGSVKLQWLHNLHEAAKREKILFGCSLFLPKDVGEVQQYMDFFKVSSFEAGDSTLIKAIEEVRGDRPFFVSLGMGGSYDLPEGVIRLHCVSAYPCPPNEANLGAIEYSEGYSDHTKCVFTGALAVAHGAQYLEVHFRLDETPEHILDWKVSLTPSQLQDYIGWAHQAYRMGGTGERKPQPSELANMKHRVIR